MGVSGWPAQGAGKYSVRRSGKLYKKRLKELRIFSRSCVATAMAEFSSDPVFDQKFAVVSATLQFISPCFA